LKLLLRESTSHAWEDRLDACKDLARHVSNPSAPTFSNRDAALFGKCCARQLNDKRPKVLAAFADLVRACMARTELQAEVAIPALPALLLHSVSSKRSFKLPAKQALSAISLVLALETNGAVADKLMHVFSSSRSSPKLRTVVLKMFLGAFKNSEASMASPSAALSSHFVTTLETVMLRALTDKSNDVRTAARLLFSRFVEHCPVRGAALFHSSKMKLAIQKQLRRACPEAVEACVSLTYMGENHPGSDVAEADETAPVVADARTETETVVVAKTNIVKETASLDVDPTATVTTTTVTTTTTTTTTVRTPPRKTKERGEDLPAEGTRLASLLQWKARSEKQKKYQARDTSSPMKKTHQETCGDTKFSLAERRRKQMMSPTMRKYLPAQQKKDDAASEAAVTAAAAAALAAATAAKKAVPRSVARLKPRIMNPLSPISSVVNTLASPAAATAAAGIAARKVEMTSQATKAMGVRRRKTFFLTPSTAAVKEEERFLQLRKRTLSKLAAFLARPKPNMNAAHDHDGDKENTSKSALVLTPLFDLHGLVFVPPTPTEVSPAGAASEGGDASISFSRKTAEADSEHGAASNVGSTMNGEVVKNFAKATAARDVDNRRENVRVRARRALKERLNASLLRENVLGKMDDFLNTRRKARLTAGQNAAVAAKISKTKLLRAGVLGKFESFLSQRRVARRARAAEAEAAEALRIEVVSKFESFIAQRRAARQGQVANDSRKREQGTPTCEPTTPTVHTAKLKLVRLATPSRPPTPTVAAATTKRVAQKPIRKRCLREQVTGIVHSTVPGTEDDVVIKTRSLSHRRLMAVGVATMAVTAVAALRGMSRARLLEQNLGSSTETSEQAVESLQAEADSNALITPTLHQSFPPSHDPGSCFPVATSEKSMFEGRQLCFVEDLMEFVYWVPTPTLPEDIPSTDRATSAEETTLVKTDSLVEDSDSLEDGDGGGFEETLSDARIVPTVEAARTVEPVVVSREICPMVYASYDFEAYTTAYAKAFAELEDSSEKLAAAEMPMPAVTPEESNSEGTCYPSYNFEAHAGSSTERTVVATSSSILSAPEVPTVISTDGMCYTPFDFEAHAAAASLRNGAFSAKHQSTTRDGGGEDHLLFPASEIFAGMAALAATARVLASFLSSLGWTKTVNDASFSTPPSAQTDPSQDYHYSDSSGFEDNADSESSFSPSSTAANNDSYSFAEDMVAGGVASGDSAHGGPTFWIGAPTTPTRGRSERGTAATPEMILENAASVQVPTPDTGSRGANARGTPILGSFTGLEIRRTRHGMTRVTPVRRSRRVKKCAHSVPQGSASETVSSSAGGLVIEQHIAAAIVQSVVKGQVGLGEAVEVEQAEPEEQAEPRQPLRRSRRIAGRS
jgi:hypothetical protein